MRNKIFSGISLVTFLLFVFGHKISPSTNLYSLLSESHKLILNYTEKLWTKAMGEIKESSLERIRAMEKQQTKTQDNLDKCSSKNNEMENKLRKTISTRDNNLLKCETEKNSFEEEIERRILDTSELQDSYTELLEAAKKTIGVDIMEILAIDEAKKKKE